MVRVVLSKFNWTPGADATKFGWEPGEIVQIRSRKDPNKTTLCRMVDGEPKLHESVPGGFVFELEFLDGSGTWAIDARLVEPAPQVQDEIVRGRRELGIDGSTPR